MIPEKKNDKDLLLSKLYQGISRYSFLFLFYALGLIMPLYYQNSYFDLMEAKHQAFLFIMRVMFPIALLVFAGKIISRKIKLSLLNISVFYFLLNSLISTVFSFSSVDAFTGRQGWYVGFFAILCLCLCFFAYQNEERIVDQKLFMPILVLALFEFVLTIAEVCGIDLLSMKTGIPVSSQYAYFATIGNSNWYAGYLSLWVPASICLYLASESRTKTTFCFLLSLTGMLASLLVGADSIFISAAISLFIILMYSLQKKERIRKLSFLFILFSISIFLIKYNSNYPVFSEYYDSIGNLVFENSTIIALFLFSVLVFLAASVISEIKYKVYKKYVLIVVMTVLSVSAILLSVKVIDFRGDRLDNYRFELWRYSIRKFKEFDTFHQLFGWGPELLRNIYAGLSTKIGIIYTVSHSEPIQMLLSMGVSGLFAWVFCWCSIFIQFIKTKSYRNERKIGLYCGLFAYFGQSFVNSATILNLCTLLLFLLMVSIAEEP